MHIRIFLALAMLVLSLPAAAEFSTITQAYEVDLGDLRLPGNVGGTLAFKKCSECASQTIQVNSKTRYVLNGRAVGLERFKSEVEFMRGSRDGVAIVMHHLESNVITRIKVRFR